MQNNKIIEIIYKNIFTNNSKRFFSYKFTPSHEWCRIIKDNKNNNSTFPDSDKKSKISTDMNKCLIGITNYANIAIEKVTNVELPNVNDEIKFDEPIIIVKTLEGDIKFKSPVSGKVLKINSKLVKNPSLINKPLGLRESWALELLINDQNKQIIKNKLMDQLEYAHYCEDVDFFK